MFTAPGAAAAQFPIHIYASYVYREGRVFLLRVIFLKFILSLVTFRFGVRVKLDDRFRPVAPVMPNGPGQ